MKTKPALSSADLARIITLVVAVSLTITGPVLESFGIPQTTATHIAAIVGWIATVGTIISKIISTPSPQAGTNYAMIPQGSVPVVTDAPGTGRPSVAVADPKIVLQTTDATVAPPPQTTQTPQQKVG